MSGSVDPGLAELVREAFGLVLAGLVPLWAAAAVVVILVGLLAGLVGVRDAALGQIARALAVVLALGAIGQGLARATVAFAAQSWSALGRAQATGSATGPEPRP